MVPEHIQWASDSQLAKLLDDAAEKAKELGVADKVNEDCYHIMKEAARRMKDFIPMRAAHDFNDEQFSI